jgi:cytochrome c55X
VVLAPALAEEPPASRQAELLYLLEQDCGSCHGLTRKGGLGPSLLPEAIAGRSDEELVATILAGSARRQPMPPWGHELDPEEAAWIVAELRRGPTPAP